MLECTRPARCVGDCRRLFFKAQAAYSSEPCFSACALYHVNCINNYKLYPLTGTVSSHFRRHTSEYMRTDCLAKSLMYNECGSCSFDCGTRLHAHFHMIVSRCMPESDDNSASKKQARSVQHQGQLSETPGKDLHLTHARFQCMPVHVIYWQSSRTHKADKLLLICIQCYCHTAPILRFLACVPVA
jgi:hypothetical protein